MKILRLAPQQTGVAVRPPGFLQRVLGSRNVFFSGSGWFPFSVLGSCPAVSLLREGLNVRVSPVEVIRGVSL